MKDNIRKYIDLYDALKELEKKMSEKDLFQAQSIILSKEKIKKCSLV